MKISPYATGYTLGAALGSIRDIVRQKAEAYESKKRGKGINPYRVAKSAILGGVLGIGLVGGGKAIAGLKSTIKPIPNNINKTMTDAQGLIGDMRGVANKAKTKRFFGLFSRR